MSQGLTLTRRSLIDDLTSVRLANKYIGYNIQHVNRHVSYVFRAIRLYLLMR